MPGAGFILAYIWPEGEHTHMPVIDSLGEDFLNYVKDGSIVSVE